MDIYEYPSAAAEKRIQAVIDRGVDLDPDDEKSVRKILADVKKRGDAALIDYTHRFDAPDLAVADMAVTEADFSAAEKVVDPQFLSALHRAVDQIMAFHRRQLRKSWFSVDRPGVVLGQMVNAVGAAGIYVPGAKGGKTPLVSSVLMGGIPAKIAGVGRTAMVTPPMADGKVNPHLLVAAKTVGIDAVYKVGSAWAIAALAYGTQTIPAVDVIVGPGNKYVTLAKKLVSGTVGIDMIAGPSEILVIADYSADPDCIAADMLSQAEHDPVASAILITDAPSLAEAVVPCIERRLKQLPRQDIAAKSLAGYGGIMVVPDMDTAVSLANRIAPEHLELLVRDPFGMLGSIKNAGAVFMGQYTPEPVGDYIAGPNHVLPTGGTARFSSALSVDCFIKQTSVIYYNSDAFQREAADIMRLADTEGLGAHAASVGVRIDTENADKKPRIK